MLSRWRQRCGGTTSSSGLHSCTGQPSYSYGHSSKGQASSLPPPSSPPSALIGLATGEAPSASMERVSLRTDSANLTQPRETRCAGIKERKKKCLSNNILLGHLCQLLHFCGVPESYQLELPPRKPCRESQNQTHLSNLILHLSGPLF